MHRIGPESLLRIVTLCWICPPGKTLYVKVKQTAIDHPASKLETVAQWSFSIFPIFFIALAMSVSSSCSLLSFELISDQRTARA